MFLQLRAFIGKHGYHQYLIEQKKRSNLYLNKIILHAKSSCRERGASSIGLVITVFFIFLLILLPMNLFVQELNVYRMINHKVQMATEMACFDVFFHLDVSALSEENLILDNSLLAAFESDLSERLMRTDALNIDFENLAVVFLKDQHPGKLQVKFEYPYEMQFLLKGILTKRVSVALNYELPINN